MVRGAVRRNHEVYTAFYVADTFRATSKLTLDLGLRWELDFPFYEVSGNLLSNVNLSAINPVSGTPGVITFADVDGQPTGLWNTDYKRFHPRIGFAYQVGSKTVIRGGYGLYGVSPGVKPNNVGFDPVNVSFATTDNGLTPAFYLRDGFPAWQKGGDRSKLNASFGAVRVGQVPTTNPTWVQRDYRLGHAQNFNISVQQELPGQFMFEVAGIGALGRD